MKLCQVRGCNNKILKKGYCGKHYLQMWRHGRIFERTRFDPNDFTIRGGRCYISLYTYKNKRTCEGIIDIQDIKICKKHKWHLTSAGYIATRFKGKIILIHNLILNIKGIDHIDLNPLNNCRENIRIATQSENLCNQKKRKNTSSIYKGVVYCKPNKNWQAQIRSKRKIYYLGSFNDEKEAAKAYNIAAQKFHGVFARLHEF